MKRVIKFRAWVKAYDDGDGEMLQLPMQVLRFDFEEGWVVAFGESGFWACECYENREPYQFELMQFTGLYDKNGREIYEGDILSAGDGGFFEVKHQLAQWTFCHTPASRYIAYPSPHSNASRMEVIGNIHKNPELLEAK